MARAGQPDGLRPLAGAHIENASGRRSQVPVQLARDHLLPDDIAHLVQPAQPDRTPITERAVSHLAAACHVPSGHPTTLPGTLERRHEARKSGGGMFLRRSLLQAPSVSN